MPRLYLYASVAGAFVLNQNFHVIDRLLFNEAEAAKSSKLIEEGRLADAEKQMLAKHKKGDFVIMGFRLEKPENAKVSFSENDYTRINEALLNERGMFAKLKELNTAITRMKIRDSVNTEVFMIQAVKSIKELEKISNMMAKRLREWYGYYLPEFSESIEDHEKFAEIIARKDRNILLKELRISREQSMGAEIKKTDIEQMIELAKSLSEMYVLKKKQSEYLERLMKETCPNMQAVAGTLIAAKLLEQAGSLKKLAEFPSSTIQILGAEDAFFRHIKTGSRMPKHGFIHEHPFIAKADKKSKGRIARTLADKISIAAKVDYFKGKFIGDKLRKQVEAKLGK